MTGTVLFGFEGALARRPGGGIARLLLDAFEDAGAGSDISLQSMQTLLRGSLPWHRPAEPHPEFNSDPDAWWAHVESALFSACLAAGVDVDTAAEAAGSVRVRYTDPAEWELYPETLQTLDYLQDAGLNLGIVANSVPELFGIVLGLGIADRFHAIVSSAVVGHEKPSREIFRIALRSGEPADRAWVVGAGRNADLGGAAAFGIPGILVRRPQPDGRTLDLLDAAQLVIRDLREASAS